MNSADLTARIGSTPLLRICRIWPADSTVQIYAKAEWANPGGSVKDRAAWRIVRDAFERGLLGKGQTLVDATSGNTGIAYAMLGAALSFPVRLYLPANASHERKRILQIYGAEVVPTDPLEGSDGAIRAVRKALQEEKGSVFYADQYGNPMNPRAHYETTAEEIWRQTDGRVTHFVAGLGTSGTFCGTTRRLKELNPAVQCLSFEPDSPFHGLEGMKHMATAIVPGIYDERLADRKMECSTEEAHATCRRAAREEGLLLGISAGAALATAVRLACELEEVGKSAVIVTIFPDGADRYLSDSFWQESEKSHIPNPSAQTLLVLSAEHEAAIRAHGEKTYPHEACGALLGKAQKNRKEVCATLAVANAFGERGDLAEFAVSARESQANRYLIPPEEILRIEKEARRLGLDVIGFYHSHPDHPARPSAYDQEHAWPWLSYVIVRVAKGRSEDLASFVLSDDRSVFAPEEVKK